MGTLLNYLPVILTCLIYVVLCSKTIFPTHLFFPHLIHFKKHVFVRFFLLNQFIFYSEFFYDRANSCNRPSGLSSRVSNHMRLNFFVFLQSSGDSGANVKRLEQETDAKIDHLKTEASRISHDIVSMLLRHVTTVKN